MKELKKCVICGKSFKSEKYNAKYCSETCKDKGRRAITKENDRIKRERAAKARKARNNSKKPLINIAAEAKGAGMSYGQYVAKMGL